MSVPTETYTLPRDPDAKWYFEQQKTETRLKARAVKSEIAILAASADIRDKDSDAHHKLDFLRASFGIYKGIMKMVSLRDTSMAEEYEDYQELAADRKQSLDEAYVKMTQLLRILDNNFSYVLGLPQSWFSMRILKATNWVKENPKLAMATGVSLTVAGGCALGVYNWAYGHCILFELFGCVCESWGVAQSVAVGAGMGVGLGAIALCVTLCCTYYSCQAAPDDTASAYMKIADMVERFKKIPEAEMGALVEEMIERCGQAFGKPGFIPGNPADRKCIICLATEGEVVKPIRAPRCRGPHYMCLSCWSEVARRSDDCPVCRI